MRPPVPPPPPPPPSKAVCIETEYRFSCCVSRGAIVTTNTISLCFITPPPPDNAPTGRPTNGSVFLICQHVKYLLILIFLQSRCLRCLHPPLCFYMRSERKRERSRRPWLASHPVARGMAQATTETSHETIAHVRAVRRRRSGIVLKIAPPLTKFISSGPERAWKWPRQQLRASFVPSALIAFHMVIPYPRYFVVTCRTSEGDFMIRFGPSMRLTFAA